MFARFGKNAKSINQTVANELSQEKKRNVHTFRVIGNHQNAFTQRKLKEIINKSESQRNSMKDIIGRGMHSFSQLLTGTTQRKLKILDKDISNKMINGRGAFKTNFNKHIRREANIRGQKPSAVRGLLSNWANDDLDHNFASKRNAAAAASADLARVQGIENRVNALRAARSSQPPEIGRTMGNNPKGETWVEDEYSKTEKGIWTHFCNRYSNEAATMVENYRNASTIGKRFFASDVFFDQLAAVTQGISKEDGDLLQQLPEKLPGQIIRDTISNDDTKNVLKGLFKSDIEKSPGKECEWIVQKGSKELSAINNTPNGKATVNIIQDFNSIQKIRGLPLQTIQYVIVEWGGFDPDSGWKIKYYIE